MVAIIVCHDGADRLPAVLDALRASTVRPRHVLAVDTGSRDDGGALCRAADDLVDGVLTLGRDVGFGDAIRAALGEADRRWGDPGPWLWVLHDDSAPEPDCLAGLLAVAESSPSAAVLGPLCLDWDDPRLVTEAGLSTDASGHRQTGIGAVELDLGQFGQNAEVLAVSSAGALIRRDTWDELGGYDPELPIIGDDVDYGWRLNRAGHVVLCVPSARLRHTTSPSVRGLDAVRGHAAHAGLFATAAAGPRARARAVQRAHGVRTYLVNCSTAMFVLGLGRLAVLLALRAVGFAAIRRLGAARAELAAARYVYSGAAGLRAARASRLDVGDPKSVGGLLTSRTTRLRNGARNAAAGLLRRRVLADAALGRVPERSSTPVPDIVATRPIGPGALPTGVAPTRGARPIRRAGGLRRPVRAVAVPVPDTGSPPGELFGTAAEQATAGRRRPSPVRRDGSGQSPEPALVMVTADTGRLVREVLVSPAVALVAVASVLAVVINRSRLGVDLAGGRLLAPDGLGTLWASYLASWNPTGGGTGAPAPAALAVLGVLGAPVGSPALAVSLVMLAAVPLAAASAYLASSAIPATRSARAIVAGLYAVLPAGTAGVAQGRLDVVVAHVLLPAVLAGTVAVLRAAPGQRHRWLGTAAATAIGLAVISAFTPALHVLVLVTALVGFVVVPASSTVRRGVGLFVVVLAPAALLLPWPAVVVQRPTVLLHGVGAAVPESTPRWLDLITLNPGGPGAAGYVGVLVVGLAVLTALLRPAPSMVAGFAIAVLGGAAVAVTGTIELAPLAGGTPRPGFTGAASLFAACGLLWAVLVGLRVAAPSSEPRTPGAGARVTPVLAGAVAVVLAVGAAVFGAQGSLRPGGASTAAPALAPSVVAELARERSALLVIGPESEPVRLTRGGVARFGDDDLAPLRTGRARLDRVAAALRGAEPGEASAAVADVAALGVAFVVLPDSDGERVLAAVGDLAQAAPPTDDGRAVLRVSRPSPGAELLGPQLAQQARTGAAPPVDPEVVGVPVPALAPTVGVRVADGADGRLLVLAAHDEPGWSATIDGVAVPVIRAWGTQVAVAVPAAAVDVRLDRSTVTRSVLLLVQAAVVLLCIGTALPSRRRDDT